MRRLLVLPLLLMPAACDQMNRQPKGNVYGSSTLFANGEVEQPRPQGAIARDDPASSLALDVRPTMTPALIERGRERYNIYCVVCHDPAGTGQGAVPARGFPHPPSYHIDRLRTAPSRHIVDVITNGYGVMYSYADRVPPADCWAIAAYVRALQFSQDAPVSQLAPQDVAAVEASHGG